MWCRSQHQWQQAEQYYQQALQIFIDYNDRYAQAGTYRSVRLTGSDTSDCNGVRHVITYLHALEIFIAFEDDYYIGHYYQKSCSLMESQ